MTPYDLWEPARLIHHIAELLADKKLLLSVCDAARNVCDQARWENYDTAQGGMVFCPTDEDLIALEQTVESYDCGNVG